MKKYFFISILLLFTTATFAQPGKKQTRPPATQSGIDKIMEEALSDLSPEERKMAKEAMQMGKEMQQKGMTGNITSGEVTIPKKQVQLLSNIPSLTSQQQYNTYISNLLTECKKNIQPAIIAEVNAFFLKNGHNAESIANAGPVFFLQKKPAAAVYAAIRTAMSRPDDLLLQDNLAVILHQTGYPQKTIPILHFLLSQSNHPIILNNLGQSYLSLGDTANARRFFMGCLRKDPDHSAANCGMGLLLTEAGKPGEATPYIIRSLKNGYSETADALVKKNKIQLRFSDIKQKVPEYFNPQKYKPVPPAYSMEMVESTEALRTELDEKMRYWMQKKDKVHEEQSNKIEKENLQQIMDRSRGYVSNAPMAKKAQLMVNLIGIEFAAFLAADYKNQYLPVEKGYQAQLEKKLKDMYGGNQHYDNAYEVCVKKIEILNAHLPLSAKNHLAYQQKTLPKVYDFVNQSLYWWYFLQNEEQYKLTFHYYVSDFFERMHDYDDMQNLHPTPLWIATDCKDIKKPAENKKVEEDSLAVMDCPIKIEIPMGVGKAKWDCKTFEIEGGELIMGGLERNFQTGEITLFVGLGVGFFGKGTLVGGIEGGAKVGSFVKLGKDLTILDMGNKGEIGAEAGIGPFMTEGKVTGIMGMESGINVDGVAFGKDYHIFDYGTNKN
jgi:hypothetical protein